MIHNLKKAAAPITLTPANAPFSGMDFVAVAGIPPDPKERGEYYQVFKDLIRAGRARILAWHEAGAGGREVVQAHTALIDQVVKQVVTSLANLEAYRKTPLLDAFVLVAVGGYGRGELNPNSDIDLLFLCKRQPKAALDRFIQEIISVLWGIGLEIGSSCRTLRDCQSLAQEDPTIRTSMIETRRLIGDLNLYRKLHTSVRKKVLKKNAKEFLNAQFKEKFQRHENGQHAASHPEPDLKEGPGGLRDYHVALWASAVRFGGLSIREIGRDNLVSSQELESMEQSVDFLLRVRNALHYITEKKTDVLTLTVQEPLAQQLGYAGSVPQPAVERFMQDYFLHAKNIHQIAETIFHRCLEMNSSLKRVFSHLNSRDLGDGFRARKALLSYTEAGDAAFQHHPERLLRVFALCREHDLRPDAQLTRLLRQNQHLMDPEVLGQDQARAFLLDLLSDPSAEPLLRVMHEVGILGRILPEFGKTHCRVQFDYYHRFTTDEHALRMVRFLEELPTSQEPGIDKLAQIYQEVQDKVLLKSACLLHSMGDGLLPPASGEEAADSLDTVLARLKFKEPRASWLRFLVENLNTMNEMAFHQDIHQPAIIRALARAVETPQKLDLLLLFSYAELKAVAPDTWTAWKRLLLIELFHRTRNYLVHPDSLEQKPATTRASVYRALAGKVDRRDIDAHFSQMLDDYLVTAGSHDIVQHIRLIREMNDCPLVLENRYDPAGGFYDVVLAIVQQPDVFMNLVGTLTAKAMNILGAQIYTRADDLALIHLQVEGSETFRIHGEDQKVWDEVKKTLGELMARRTKLPKLMASRTRLMNRPDDSKVPIIPKVELDNLLENRFTFIRIEARDHPGMLYKIAKAFADFNILIHRAKIACRGGRGIDVFSISHHGQKIHQEPFIRRLKDQIITNLLVEKLEDLR